MNNREISQQEAAETARVIINGASTRNIIIDTRYGVYWLSGAIVLAALILKLL